MAEIKQMTLNGTTYNLKDETARNSISDLEETVENMETGGSDVSYTASLTSGTKVGTLTIDGTSYSLYAPTSSSSTTTIQGGSSAINIGEAVTENNYVYTIGLNPTRSVSTLYVNSSTTGSYSDTDSCITKVTPISSLGEIGGGDVNNVGGLGLFASTVTESSNNTTHRAGLRIFSCISAVVPVLYQNGTLTDSGNTITLGTSNQRFSTVYCTSVSESSDKNLKQSIVNIQEDSRKDSYLELFDDLEISTYKFKNLQSENEVNPYTAENHKRTHIGLIAQDVEDLIKAKNLSSNDFSAVKSEFFRSSGAFDFCVTGGAQGCKDGYDYSENTYNYKHSFDEENPTEYHTYNELVDKLVSRMNIASYRSNIQYLHVTDNSKLTGNQPPLTINAVIFEKEDGTQLKIDNFSLEGNVCDYCPNSASYEDDYYTGVYNRSDTPMSSAVINDNGSITISFDRMYGTYLIKLFDEPIDITEYETVYFDVDYISEYKFILYPEGEYKNSEWGDREWNDPIIYDYSLDYKEVANLTTFALQETRKELAETKAELEELKEKVNELLQ